MNSFPPIPSTEEKTWRQALADRNQEASDWMHRGIDLLRETAAAPWEEAIRSFDRAIALRQTLPLGENPFLRYGLSAGWLNRGDALTKLGEERLAEALQSYDRAIALLETLSLGENPLYPRRLAIAWINRGAALQAPGSAPKAGEAAAAFRRALGILGDPAASGIADLSALQAGAWANLAGALAADGSAFAEARAAAGRALALAQPSEFNDPALAGTSLHARSVLCRIAVQELADGSASDGLFLSAAAAAADALRLARHWRRKEGDGFAGTVREIFRFGCRLHESLSADALIGFLDECFEPREAEAALPLDREALATAQAAIWSSLRHRQEHGFPPAGTPAFEPFLADIRRLRETEERLRQLHSAGI